LKDQKTILPVSSYLDDYLGIHDVCFGVPSILGRNGVEELVPIRLLDDEENRLKLSAATLREFMKQIRF
jgi:L-lactate dehydrogenase